MRARLAVIACGCALAWAAACDSGNKTPAAGPAPMGAGYDDLRVLSRDDCMALRDHQIDIAVDDALAQSDAGWSGDAAQRMVLEADLRLKEKTATDAWIQRCTGRMITSADLRCLREATTTQTFNACGAIEDDGGVAEAGDVADGGSPDGDAGS